MRIALNNSKSFFDEILSDQKLTLRKLSKLTGLNYSNLKGYRRGELTMPEEVFNHLLRFVRNKDVWTSNVKKIDDNWGCIKGGRVSASSCNIDKRMEAVRKFRKVLKVNIKLNKFFCEFYGALLGDGCVTRYENSRENERYLIVFSGNKTLDSDYLKYFKKRLLEEYGLGSYFYQYKHDNICTLTITNKNFALDLHNLYEVPVGLKYDTIKISEPILNLPWNVKKFVLRGLFDTDGCIFARKDEGYRLPHISICSKNKFFREQICNLLREQGYPAYINNINVRIKGIKNVKRWFSDIGSSNSRNMKKYEYFLKHGVLPARLLTGP